MKHGKFVTTVASLLALAAIGAATPAKAQGGVAAGILSCDVSSGWGFVFGSSKNLKCTYSNGATTGHYNGTVNKFGVDVGFTQASVIIWTVLAPSADISKGGLAGTYVGATGSASVGPGLGANVLIGGGAKSIALQPVSFSGGSGLNVAAGIAGITLVAAP